MRIVVDGMGGDNAPAAIVEGAVLASEKIREEIYLIGREEELAAELSKYDFDEAKIKIIDASEVIANEEAPVRAVRTKKDSSIV
ncbi:MAG: phosphate--acyl-ACP acyltransferase, partial [Firmicutes bacterium]|nr:phosphate--acyl-ACP acyltransferase [Bacillota bacterium]